MKSVILLVATRYLMPLMLLLSVFIMLRGHNEPGGGFIGGLIAAAAFALFSIAYDVEQARRLLRVHPLSLIGAGLLVALGSGLIPVITGRLPFLTGLWLNTELPAVGKPGTPLFFDIGVYMVVIGVTLLIIFTLAEE